MVTPHPDLLCGVAHDGRMLPELADGLTTKLVQNVKYRYTDDYTYNGIPRWFTVNSL